MIETQELQNLCGSWGAQVPITRLEQANSIIDKVLVPDATATLSRKYPDEAHAIIEIRGKVCSHHGDKKGIGRYGDKCPDEHKGRQMCGIAWIHFDGSDSLNPVLPEEPLFDFDGKLKPMHANVYYELARIKLELEGEPI